ncbi:hypothetical protein A6A04_06685 [Paramagnetospirillum marisnigri]|uniref:Radical SAM core domain-containing protein n=1 Tax=Paramagnetospirillum marisnigri TaxID=1285242 RepID=A0A178MA03_9PROT|nr:radical SAM protein [Paramagnetospirillum marisnigri]OAN45579.1 hypothetical protein A6A04_06685 [Paramagnetospirillum marisnigri]
MADDIFTLPFGIEMDIAQSCNLHCRFCSHYSNYGLKGLVPLKDSAPWLAALKRRVIPKHFQLLGGEPTLNPELCDYIVFVRELWPEVDLIVASNGLLLDRQPDLWRVLAETGAKLAISRHSSLDQAYLAKFEPAMDKAREQASRFGVDLTIRQGYAAFARTYLGEGPSMRPYAEGNPAASWELCTSKYCTTLFRGRLWKCPPIAFLPLVAAKFGLDSVPEWQPYLSYGGLDVMASASDYAAFLNANYAPQSICGMCPTRWEIHEHVDVMTAPRFPAAQ